MEKKSIGGFIAALRRASGLTQKQLAERLGVSDKSVSRWERDESAPDLALIPIIAELFGVTSDELLRGERIQRESDAQSSPRRSDRERRRLLSVALARYKNRSFIAAGVSVCGLLIAMLLNFAFLRAYAGFFAGCVCFAAAAVAQLIFKNQAELAVGDEDIPESELGEYRFAVVRTAQIVLGLDLTLLCATTPLLYAVDSSYGLSFGSFFSLALCYGLAAALVFSLGAQWLNCSRMGRGLWVLGDGLKNRYVSLFRLRRSCVLSLCAVLIASAFLCGALTGFGDTHSIADKEIFHDVDSFKSFMETPAGDYANGDRHTINNPDGDVIDSFVWLNGDVSSYSVTWQGDELVSLAAITDSAIEAARIRAVAINNVFVGVYALEIVSVAAIYILKRSKIK